RDDRHHHVQLELTVLRRCRDARVVAENLKADLVHHLRDRGVDFARHDRRPRLHGGQSDLVQTRPGSAGEEPQVAGDFAQIDGEHFDLRAESGDIAHALHQLDPIFALAQIQSGRGTQVFHHQRRVFRLDIHTGSDGATANPQVTQIIGGIDYALQTPPQRTRVCLELLAQSYR